jgi:methylmalonyl-CoA mutase N-terminal domain/subunit
MKREQTAKASGNAAKGAKPQEKKKKEVREVYTSFGEPVKLSYGPEDIDGFDYQRDLGEPGSYPFVRGVYPTMYRSQYWIIRQYAGMATSDETNERFKFLLKSGQTGLSMAFDLPTQLGMDSDHPMAKYDVGKQGVAVDTLDDMERIFEGIGLDQISTSFTINSTAPIILAMYILVGKKQGVSPERLRGTVQNDLLKEFVARGTWIFPPKPSMRLIADTIEYCIQNIPRFNPISVSATHLREYGASAEQSVSLPILNALAYIDEVKKRGYHIDQIAPLMVFHMVVGGRDFHLFEDVAKLRAGRRLWARLMKERYGAEKPESMRLKFSTGLIGGGMTAAEPLNNIARSAYCAMAATLAGTRSLNLACFDEALAIPTDLAIRTSVRVQQILAHETGIADTVDPLAGSYYIEWLTNQMEAQMRNTMEEIEGQGGIVKAIEEGALQRKLAKQSFELQEKISKGERVLVGVNRFTSEEEEKPIEFYRPDPKTRESQIQRLNAMKADRDAGKVEEALRGLRRAAEGTENIFPALFEAVEARATVGEMISAMKEVFGEFKEPRTV